MLLLGGERLLERSDQLIVTALLSQLNQQFPTGVVRQFDRQQSLETLRKRGAGIRDHLNHAQRSHSTHVGAGGLSGGVATHVGNDAAQHLEMLEFLFADVVQIRQQGGLFGVRGHLHLRDHGLVEPHAAALIGSPLAQFVEEHFRVLALQFANDRFGHSLARGGNRYGADPQRLFDIESTQGGDVFFTPVFGVGRILLSVLHLLRALLGRHLHARPVHPDFRLVFHFSSSCPMQSRDGSVPLRVTIDSLPRPYWSASHLH